MFAIDHASRVTTLVWTARLTHVDEDVYGNPIDLGTSDVDLVFGVE